MFVGDGVSMRSAEIEPISNLSKNFAAKNDKSNLSFWRGVILKVLFACLHGKVQIMNVQLLHKMISGATDNMP